MSELFGWLKINLIYRIPMGFRKMVRLESGDFKYLFSHQNGSFNQQRQNNHLNFVHRANSSYRMGSGEDRE